MDNSEMKFELDFPGRNPELPQEFSEKPYIKVYIASALTGREDDRDYDDRVRASIRDVFSKAAYQKVPYLIKYQAYDPAEHTSPGSSHQPEEVYHIDFKQLIGSDFALFYVNAASLGVGIERQIAGMGGVPAAWISREVEEVSRMFQGSFGGSLFKVKFCSLEELKLKLANEVSKFGPELFQKALRRRQIIRSFRKAKIPQLFFKRRIFLNIPTERIAKETGIGEFWWIQIERDPSGLIAGGTFTPILSCQLREILRAGCGMSDCGFPHFNLENNLGEVEDQSLDNLYETYISRKDITDDEVVRHVWENHSSKKFPNEDNTLWESNAPVSKEEWLLRICECEKIMREEQENGRISRVLQINLKTLSDTHRKSVDTLCAFLCTVNQVSDQNLTRLWKHFLKDIEDKTAARGGDATKMRLYSVEDWRNLFNGLHFQD